MLDSAAFVHKRRHNIYFDDRPTELADNHPALKQFETINHTICADQIPGSLICRIYEWPPLATFLAAVLDKTELHLMADPLARVNVIAYRAGEALNWHFDRSEFTTTLILQSPARGGEFQYRDALRSDDDANYEGVGRTNELLPCFPTTKTVTWFLPKKSAWGSMAVPSNAEPGDEGNIRGSVDVTALRHERLARLRAILKQADVAAGLFFDPINIRYATGVSNMQVWCLHNPTRYAFVATEGRTNMRKSKHGSPAIRAGRSTSRRSRAHG